MTRKKTGHNYERALLWEQRNTGRVTEEHEKFRAEPAFTLPTTIHTELHPKPRRWVRWKDLP